MRSLVQGPRVVALFALAVTLTLASANADPAFVTVDPQDDRVYRYDNAGLLVGSFALSLGNDTGLGIAVLGNAFHVLDRRNRKIYQYDGAGALLAVSRELRQATGDALSTTAGAVAIDDDELWVVDRGRGKLFRYSLEAAFEAGGPLSAAQEIVLEPANARAEGLTIDAAHLYVLDHIDRQLYRYRRDGAGPVDVSRVMTEVDGDSTRAPFGLARVGEAVLVVDASRDKVYTYDLTSLFTGSGQLDATSETRLDSANGNARDVAALEAPGAETTTTATAPISSSTTVTATTTTSSTTGTGATTTTTSTTQTTLPPTVSALVTVDAQDKRVYRYDDAGSLTGSFPVVTGNDHPNGVSVHLDTLRVLDSADRRLYEYDASGTLLTVSRELRQADGATLGTTAGAVAIDGDDLWVVDRGEAKLFRYSVDAAFTGDEPLDAIQEIALHPDDTRAEGLAIDATYLYVLDQIDRQLYRYRRDGTGSVDVSGVMTGADGDSLGAPYGAARVGGSVFVVDGSRDGIFSYDLASLFAGTDQVAASTEITLDPTNDDARDVAAAP